MVGLTHGRMDSFTDGQSNGQTYCWNDGWTDGQTDGRTGTHTDHQTNGLAGKKTFHKIVFLKMMAAFHSHPHKTSLNIKDTCEKDHIEVLTALASNAATPGNGTNKQRNHILNDVYALKKKLQHIHIS